MNIYLQPVPVHFALLSQEEKITARITLGQGSINDTAYPLLLPELNLSTLSIINEYILGQFVIDFYIYEDCV